MNESLLSELKAMLQDSKVDLAASLAITTDSLTNGPFLSSIESGPLDLRIARDRILGDRYQIIRDLGQGIKPVYQAYDLRLECDVALKIVVAAPACMERPVEQLQQELLLRTPISDFSYIIKTFDIHPVEFEGLSLILLAMEYADGGNLRSWLSEHERDKESRIVQGLRFLEQACLGCKVAHEQRVVHLDIKPENILLCRVDGQLVAKLSDFGISRNLRRLSANASIESLLAAGTAQYMSPEQFCLSTESKIGLASDIYSLGVVLFEILEGKLPFDGTFSELRDKHLTEKPPPLTGDAIRWSHVVDRCLAKQPENRYSDMEQLARDLNRGQKGFFLSVDIACPICCYINLDPRQVDCIGCHKSLPESYFRPCPRCFGAVRLDQDDCLLCGRKGVASYYLLEERKEAIERLKDEAPAEAIELLETVLREGAGDFEQNARGIIKDLREKQKKIRVLRETAKRAETDGRIEEAIQQWHKVLDLVPRHRLAVKRTLELEAVFDDFKDRKRKAFALMDAGQFSEAETLLQSCLEVIPNRDDILFGLKACHKRGSSYRENFQKAHDCLQQTLLHEASKHIKQALRHAPQSQEALDLASDISGRIRRIKELREHVMKLLSGAMFVEAEAAIDEIKAIEAGNTNIPELQTDLARRREIYTEAVSKSQQAMEAGNLATASNGIQEALNQCPDSSEAKSLQQQLENDKSRTVTLLEQVRRDLKAALFDSAEESLQEAERIWSCADDVKEERSEFTRLREAFDKAMASVGRARAAGDLDHALM